jgi:hypothetical protein
MDKVTIAYGSENFLYVRVYKKDPTDDTVGVNACIVEPMNMDFDGDAGYMVKIHELDMIKYLEVIHPSQLLLNTSGPGLSSQIGAIKPVWVELENYCNEDPDIEYYEEIS